MPNIDPNIFNLNRVYQNVNQSLFLEQQRGLLDSINKNNPEIWRLYKQMKKLDWDENEFPMTSCIAEFEKCNRSLYDMMIMTLAWQWEGDSVAAHNLIPIVSSFVTDSGLWNAYMRINDNENLHALAYSEIVRNSFSNPDEAMGAVLKEYEALKRIETVASVFSEVKAVGLRIESGQLSRDSDEARDAIMLFCFTMLGLERIQFMGSFFITFAIANTGWFMPIGKTVQKICTDEYTVHVELSKEVIRHELALAQGHASYLRIRDRVSKIIEDITRSEIKWVHHLFSDGRELVGHDAEDVINWILLANTDVCTFAAIDTPFEKITKNPSPWIEEWIDINANQASPQEEKTGNYFLGGVVDTAGEKVYNIDF